MKNRVHISSFLWRLLLLIWCLGVVVPIAWIFIQSLKTNAEFFQSVWGFPAIAQFHNYAKAWKNLGIGSAFFNTVFLVGLSMIFGLTVTTLNAFAFTRLHWRGRKLIWSLVMLSLFLPGINALVPQYVLMRSLHLTNSLWGLILLYSLGLSAFDLMILGSFMQSIPKELEESAYIDGASIFNVFRRIIVPLAVPGVVTIGIFKFIALYNDFLSPLIYLGGDPKKYTIGVCMFHANQLMQYKADWTTLCAGVVITIIPSILVYVAFQKRIVEGATLGAVKG